MQGTVVDLAAWRFWQLGRRLNSSSGCNLHACLLVCPAAVGLVACGLAGSSIQTNLHLCLEQLHDRSSRRSRLKS